MIGESIATLQNVTVYLTTSRMQILIVTNIKRSKITFFLCRDFFLTSFYK